MLDKLITVQELLTLQDPANFEIIAGWSGRENSFLEIQPIISTGKITKETLLVMNCHISDSEQINSEISRALNIPVKGIFLIGTPEPRITKDIIKKASNSKIPIIYLPQTQQVQDIMDSSQLINHLKKANCFYEYSTSVSSHLLRLVNLKGISSLIRHLEAILGNPLLITNSIFKEIILSKYGEKILFKNTKILKTIKNTYYKNRKIASNNTGNLATAKVNVILDDLQETNCYVMELNNDNATYGFLIIPELNNKVNKLDIVQIKQASTIIISELIKQAEIEETEKKYKDNFIYDLLHNNFESQQTLIKQGKILGWDLSKPHELAIMEVDNYKNTTEFQKLFDDLYSIISGTISTNFKNPIISEQNEQIIIIIPISAQKTHKQKKEDIRKLLHNIKKRIYSHIPEITVSFGIGRFYTSITNLCRSYQEAKTALELGKFIEETNNITHFEDLGIIQLLASISHEQLDDFCEDYLGELISFDEKNDISLLETLYIYLKENGDFNTTAKKLFIHPNTLRYRIKKIEEILKLDLEKYENILNLLIALKIFKMRKQGFGGF
ncbi:MAG: transcriptional regulator, CdaR [Clostridiales bacterium]|nr:transcriptional regulator, CdaR [Clostridiales bacterium]